MVHRPRHVDALECGIPDYKLVLISVPAGYGKTPLLAQWAHTRRCKGSRPRLSTELIALIQQMDKDDQV